MEMKYIIFNDVFPIVFPEAIAHDRVKVSMLGMLTEPTSAAKCRIGYSQKEEKFFVSVYDRSIGLDLGPGKFDEVILEKFFNGR